MSTTSDDLVPANPEAATHELKRVLGPKFVLLFIVGDILGAGVYPEHRQG